MCINLAAGGVRRSGWTSVVFMCRYKIIPFDSDDNFVRNPLQTEFCSVNKKATSADAKLF